MLGFKLIYYESLLGNSSNTTIVVKQEDGEIITQASSIGHRRRRYIDDKEMVYRLNITGLQEFTNYSVLVMSYNSFNGPYTPIVTVMTNDDGKMILLRVLTTMERNHIFYPPPPTMSSQAGYQFSNIQWFNIRLHKLRICLCINSKFINLILAYMLSSFFHCLFLF